jgi:hypothetical protein
MLNIFSNNPGSYNAGKVRWWWINERDFGTEAQKINYSGVKSSDGLNPPENMQSASCCLKPGGYFSVI